MLWNVGCYYTPFFFGPSDLSACTLNLESRFSDCRCPAFAALLRRSVGGPILTSAHPGNLELAEALGRCCAGPFRGGL